MPLAVTIDVLAASVQHADESEAPDQAMRSQKYERQKDVKTKH